LLPILSVLFAARSRQASLCDLFDTLPARYGRSALLKNFPRATALRIIKAYSPADSNIVTLRFAVDTATATDAGNNTLALDPAQQSTFLALRKKLTAFFSAEQDAAEISALNYTDGIRVVFENGEVAHIRPSGNADELRIYAFASTRERAAEIAAYGTQEPDGLLRQLEASLR